MTQNPTEKGYNDDFFN